MWGRAGALCAGLTLLVGVWQVGRASERTSLDALEWTAWAKLLPGVGAALLSVTWPAAALLATAITVAQAREDGDLMGWRGLGWGLGAMLGPWLRLTALTALGVAAVVGWLGPWALASSREVAAHALATHSAQHAGVRVALGADGWLHLPPDAPPVWWQSVDTARDQWLVASRDQAEGALQVAWLDGASPPLWVSAAQVSVDGTDLSAAHDPFTALLRLIPAVETQTATALWRARAQEPLALGQLSKRLTLALGSAALLLGLLAQALTGRWLGGAAGALAAAGGLHAWARGAELWTRRLDLLGLWLALAVALAALTITGWRLRQVAARW